MLRGITRASTERAAKVAKETLEQMSNPLDLLQVPQMAALNLWQVRALGWWATHFTKPFNRISPMKKKKLLPYGTELTWNAGKPVQ